jgi:purine-binding chemotaxis protein CheW
MEGGRLMRGGIKVPATVAAPLSVTEGHQQYATFHLGGNLYGIDVMQVQEVTPPLPMTPVRLAPVYVKGVINLRGEIATAIGLRELFGLDSVSGPEGQASVSSQTPSAQMMVVCRVEGMLLSLLVDRADEVVLVSQDLHEQAPDSLAPGIRKYLDGVYKTGNSILCAVGVGKLARELSRDDGS